MESNRRYLVCTVLGCRIGKAETCHLLVKEEITYAAPKPQGGLDKVSDWTEQQKRIYSCG